MPSLRTSQAMPVCVDTYIYISIGAEELGAHSTEGYTQRQSDCRRRARAIDWYGDASMTGREKHKKLHTSIRTYREKCFKC